MRVARLVKKKVHENTQTWSLLLAISELIWYLVCGGLKVLVGL